jgi:hypothetical protein
MAKYMIILGIFQQRDELLQFMLQHGVQHKTQHKSALLRPMLQQKHQFFR